MKSKKKKAAKTITLLARIETLLADVLDEFSVIEKSVEKNVRELLLSAEASISKAKDFITTSPSVEVRRRAMPRAVKAKAKRTVKARKVTSARAA